MFDDVQAFQPLSMSHIDQAERELTRLTEVYGPSLVILRLILEGMGVEFSSTRNMTRMPGFLFDMNIFFQRLLSRFLKENLSVIRIEDELHIHNLFKYAEGANPRRRQVPKPRPDYAAFRGKNLIGFLDAKYKDVGATDLPAAWLYQLSIYALASQRKISVLLYASMEDSAQFEKIDIHPPVADGVRSRASVCLLPVPMRKLASSSNEAKVTTTLLKGEILLIL